jgi:hypothetical protein
VIRARTAGGVLIVALLVLGTAGCGTMGSTENANASRAALAFDRSLNSPAQACRMLAPGTLSELQDTYGRCTRSLPHQHLPVANRVRHVDVYGRNAIVRLDRDVVFLARFDDGWRVTAAGCTPQVDRPFKCVLKGQ